MKSFRKDSHQAQRSRLKAFSLVEAMVSSAVVGILFVSLYAGISSGFGIISVARENLRATQIMLDRMEECRMYKYDWLGSSGNVPSTWTEPYFPANKNPGSSDMSTASGSSGTNTGGFLYYGSLTIATNAGFGETSYTNDILTVTVTLNWTNGTPRSRAMNTIVSRYGVQGYLCN